MNRWKNQRGIHTWEAPLSYHLCPSCKKIFENREKYNYEFGKYIKNLECPFCKNLFKIKKNGKPSIGPIFGEASPIEMEWENYE